MEIRKTRPEELPALLAIFARARERMRQGGNPHQWGDSRPEERVVRADIEAGNSYVCIENGEIAAVFCFFIGEEPTYRHIDGAWRNEAPYGVVHRIATAGKVRGAAAFCLAWCLRACGNLRIDTHEDNAPMRRRLAEMGFSFCGTIYLQDGAARMAFQKTIE